MKDKEILNLMCSENTSAYEILADTEAITHFKRLSTSMLGRPHGGEYGEEGARSELIALSGQGIYIGDGDF